jgi:hypothetical protein
MRSFNSNKTTLATKQPVVQILGYTPVGNGLAKIEAQVVHTSESRDNHSLVGSALRSLFSNKAKPIDNTFMSVSSAGLHETITGFVQANLECVALDEEKTPSGFRSISANLYMDAEENMWTLKKNANGNLLVKSTGMESDSALLSLIDQVCRGQLSVSSGSVVRAAKARDTMASLSGGDFVHYVNEGKAHCGYIVATDDEQNKAIVVNASGEDSVIDKAAVITKLDDSDAPTPEQTKEQEMQTSISAARGVTSVQTLLDYYKYLFRYAPEYYALREKQIKEHAFM